jgi:tRNA pseudouridine55 synthase
MNRMNWFGFLNCDKPPGMTSRDVVNVAQRRLKKIKVGHAGTLDPLAEGVLVLGLGPAARLVTHVQSYRKHYFGTFRLGEHSPSEDIESETTRPAGLPTPSKESLELAAQEMVGCITQTPSAFSAIHVNGKRAYQRARAGEVFEMPSRQVDVFSVEVMRYDFPELVLSVSCGSGTYIRSIGADLAKKVGTCAVMTALRRDAIGPFHEGDAIDIQTLKEADLAKFLLPPTLAIKNLRRAVVNAEDCQKIRFGQTLDCSPMPPPDPTTPMTSTAVQSTQTESTNLDVAAIDQQGDLVAILRRKGDQWHPYRVFPRDPKKE